MAGAVLFREGDGRPLTIASAEAVADGPGWRLRFREVTTRDAADALRGAYLESVVRPDEDLARGVVLLARGHRLRRPRHRRRGARHGQDIYRVGETEVFAVDGGPTGASTCRPSGHSSGSSRRAAARSSSTPSRSTCARRGRTRPIRTVRRRRDAGPAGASSPRRPRPPATRTRPRARRHRPRGRADPAADPAASRVMTLEIDVLTLFPAMFDGPLAASIPAGSRSRVSRPSGSTTCASGASAATARSTTRRTAGERG